MAAVLTNPQVTEQNPHPHTVRILLMKSNGRIIELRGTLRGCEGRTANVEVYARAAEVEVLLNGKRVARKKVKKNNCPSLDCCKKLTGTDVRDFTFASPNEDDTFAVWNGCV